MNSAIALIFFACIAGSMAQTNMMTQLVEQGQVIAQAVIGQLQQQILGFVQQAVGQLTSLFGSAGRFDFTSMFGSLIEQLKPQIGSAINGLLAQTLGSLSGLIGGFGGRIDFGAFFGEFLASIQKPIVELGQHFLNQGLASVLGGLGGGRAIGDLFAGLQQQISAAVTAAQGALSGALGNLAALGSGILDASKPHWEQLQEQLVGHGLNVLGSLSETINNLHGSVTGGR